MVVVIEIWHLIFFLIILIVMSNGADNLRMHLVVHTLMNYFLIKYVGEEIRFFTFNDYEMMIPVSTCYLIS